MNDDVTCSGYGPPPRRPWLWLFVAWWTARDWAADLLRRA